MLILWITLSLLAAAAFCDLRSREIPHVFAGLVLGIGVAAAAFGWNGIGFAEMALGVMLGLAAGFAFYALGGMAGGDVKLIAALGAVVGWKGLLGVMFYVAIFGGLLALIARKRKQSEYAYGPAIALGLLAYIGRGYWR